MADYNELTNVDFDKLIIDSIDQLTALSRSDSSILFMMDEITEGTITNGVEIVYGTGRKGVRLSSFDRNKTAGFSCTNGYVIASAIAAQTGTTVESASMEKKFVIPTIEMLTTTDGTSVATTYEAVGEEGNEIPYIYKANADKTQGEKFAIGAEASETEFKYEPGSNTITLPTSKFRANDVVIVVYNREVEVGKKIANNGTSFSQTARLIMDITCHDICDQNIKYHAVMEFPNAKIDGNFDMAFGNEPMVHNFGAEAQIDPCSLDNNLWSMYIA